MFAKKNYIFLVFALCIVSFADARDKNRSQSVFLEVIDSYADVHSGPGRGYPVFYVIEQGEKIEVLARRPDWYEVRTESGRVGWTTAAQISRTIQATGEPADLPSVGYGDYVKNSWVTGLSSGQFASGEFEAFETFSMTAGYRFLSWLGVDVEIGRFFGSGSSGDLFAGNANFEPFAHWKLSPIFTLGVGQISIDSQPNLISFTVEDSDFQSVGIGASYYIGRNFVIKGEYRGYFVSTEDETENLEAWKLGFNTFF